MTSEQVKGESVSKKLNVKLVISVLVIGAFIAVLNETILNVALTNIMEEFDIRYSTVQWLVAGYMLVVGTLVPISAYFLERFTTRQLFFIAMSFFLFGSIVAALSPTFSILLVGRLIQAIGTALTIPLLINTILIVVPVERRGFVMGTLISIVFMVAPAIGPTISGIIVEGLSWRWIFYLIIPVSAAAFLFGIVVLRNVTETRKSHFDFFSYLFSLLGFGGIVFGFSSAGEGDASLTDMSVLLSILVGIIFLILFVVRQNRLEEPLLDMRVFKNKMFSLSMLIVTFVMMTMFPLMIQLPLYMRGAFLFSAFIAGLAMLPGGLVNAGSAPIVGKIFDKFGPRPLIIPGSIIFVVTLLSFRYVTPGVPIWAIILPHCILMLSMAMMLMPAQTNALNQLPRELYPHGSAVVNTLLQISGAIGAPLFISISESKQHELLSSVSNPSEEQMINALTLGTQKSIFVGVFFAIIIFVLALFIKRKN